jgi:2-haloacid dehalogenase
MRTVRPHFITFDCYGTLTRFRMSDMTREVFATPYPGGPDGPVAARSRRLPPGRSPRTMATLCRGDQERPAPRLPATWRPSPPWGPHPEVPEPLRRIVRHFPLVILSNASDAQMQHDVDKLGAPFHAVFTAEQAQSYKPRMRGF